MLIEDIKQEFILLMLFPLVCYSKGVNIRNIHNWNPFPDVVVIRIGIGPHRLKEEVILQNTVTDPTF